MPKVSLVIPAWNAKDFLSLCLKSIFQQSYREFEVIVIDNGSNDGSYNYIQTYFPQVILIINKVNLGASFARNQGIEKARGDWVVTLDADVILNKDFLEKMVSSFNGKGNKLGMLAAKVYNGTGKIHTTGIALSRSRRFYDRGKNQFDQEQFDGALDIFGPSSVAALYKKEMLEEVKIKDEYFDNDFSFLVEDVDLAWRANKFGWKGRLVPEAICFHRGNSSNMDKKLRQYLCFRNRYFLILKNENFRRMILSIPVLIFYDFPRFLFLLTCNPYVMRTVKDLKKYSKNMLEKRKIIKEKLSANIRVSS